MRGLKCFLLQSDSEIAEMGAEDQNVGKWSKASAKACISHFNGDNPSKNLSSPHIQILLPVRKPYTITKEREKWTEEEHQKFLEALKQYGRGWRQIEEHVGTKTAVQIRSHAQKFFSKLVRESNSSAENPVEPIEIPPPRPKRKPLHPYPRKSADCCQENSMNEQGKYPSPNLLLTKKETGSPATILTAHGSDASASSEQTKRCLSLNSCTTEMHSGGMSPIEKETDYMTSNSSEEEKEPFSSVARSGGTSTDLLSVKFESISEETESSKGISGTVQASTIKLFGRTVSIPGGEKLCSSVAVLESIARVPNEGSSGFDKESLGLAFNNLDTQLKLGLHRSSSNPLPGETEWNSLENEQDIMCKVDSPNNASPPWLTFCQGLPTFGASNKILIPIPVYACVRERMENKKAVKESFCSGSNSSSISEVENGEKKLDVVDSQNQGLHIEVGISSQQSISQFGINRRESSRGFVPYKRCVADMKTDSVIEERSAQRARVCS